MPRDATTPAMLAEKVMLCAIAQHPKAGEPMPSEQQVSHARRILLAALQALKPEYRETLEFLAATESTLDNVDLAIAYGSAAGELQATASMYENLAELEDDERAARMDRQFIAYHAAQHRGI